MGGEPHAHAWGEGLRRKGGSGIQGETSQRVGRANTTAQQLQRAQGSFCGCGAWRGCFGLEPTPELYVEHAVLVFREVRRVLRDDGTLWLNIGDSYGGGGSTGRNDAESIRAIDAASGRRPNALAYGDNDRGGRILRHKAAGLKAKDLVGIPWMVAFALRSDGWYLRADIIWSKPNPMPESVRDRPTKAHEYLFLLSKAERYLYDADAIAEPAAYFQPNSPEAIKSPYGQGFTRRADDGTRVPSGWDTSGSDHRGKTGRYPKGNAKTFRGGGGAYTAGQSFINGAEFDRDSRGNVPNEKGTRNKRSVWTIATQPFPEAHFATFPEALVEPCILAGTSPTACGTCGAPWRRVVNVGGGTSRNALAERGESASAEAHRGLPGGPQGLNYAGRHSSNIRERQTVGWEPTCEHDDTTGACTVLDPFSGSGTTGVVALRHGRNYVGIDRSAKYLAMSRRRLSGVAPLFTSEVLT